MPGEALLAPRVAGSSMSLSRTVNRRVEVWTSTYENIEAAILDTRLPKRGTVHPNDPKLFLDTIEGSPVSDGRLDITLLYSTDGSFETFENTKQTLQDEPRLLFQRADYEVYIPNFVLTTSQLNNDDGGTVKSWEEAPSASKYVDPRVVAVYTVVVPALNMSLTQLIIAQMHKVHQFAGTSGPKFEFLGHTSQPADALHDTVTYRWQCDTGTIRDVISGPDAASLTQPPDLGGGLSRLPYTHTIAIPGIQAFTSDQVPFPPRYVSRRYAFESVNGTSYLNGWQSLPGLV